MTLQARGGANAARSRTVPMLAALAPLLIFIGIDGVVHGFARPAHPPGKFLSLSLSKELACYVTRESLYGRFAVRLTRRNIRISISDRSSLRSHNSFPFTLILRFCSLR